MEHFFQRLQVRRESLKKSEIAQSPQWKEDEERVRLGSCYFIVKYLGYTEVTDSKGSDICEQSYQKLKYEEPGVSVFNRRRRKSSSVSVGQHSTLNISGESIRIVSDNEVVIVAIPIGHISFCCPNKRHEQAFAFICKGSPAWKWQCHVVEVLFETGERMNHAFGCAFTVCLEMKMLEKRRHSDKTSDHEPPPTDTSSTSAATLKVAPSPPSLEMEVGVYCQVPIADLNVQTDQQPNSFAAPRRHSTTACYTPLERPKAPRELKERKGILEGIIMEAHPYKPILTQSQANSTCTLQEEVVELNSV